MFQWHKELASLLLHQLQRSLQSNEPRRPAATQPQMSTAGPPYNSPWSYSPATTAAQSKDYHTEARLDCSHSLFTLAPLLTCDRSQGRRDAQADKSVLRPMQRAVQGLLVAQLQQPPCIVICHGLRLPAADCLQLSKSQDLQIA